MLSLLLCPWGQGTCNNGCHSIWIRRPRHNRLPARTPDALGAGRPVPWPPVLLGCQPPSPLTRQMSTVSAGHLGQGGRVSARPHGMPCNTEEPELQARLRLHGKWSGAWKRRRQVGRPSWPGGEPSPVRWCGRPHGHTLSLRSSGPQGGPTNPEAGSKHTGWARQTSP